MLDKFNFDGLKSTHRQFLASQDLHENEEGHGCGEFYLEI